MGKYVSGMIKPLEWKPGYCDEGPCFKAEDHGQPGRTYIAFDDGDMEFMREEYEARILAQIQPDAEAEPVASSEAGELLPCPFCSSSQIEDVMRTGAVVCQDCRASATNNRQWNRRALPAARAEVSVAEAKYVIWSHENAAWWRSDSCGYTSDLRHAGIYTRDEAISISHTCRDHWLEGRKPDELPIRIADLPDWGLRALAEAGQ